MDGQHGAGDLREDADELIRFNGADELGAEGKVPRFGGHGFHIDAFLLDGRLHGLGGAAGGSGHQAGRRQAGCEARAVLVHADIPPNDITKIQQA